MTLVRTSLPALLLIGAAAVARADTPTPTADTPPATLDGTVKLSGGLLAAGVGYRWGHGTLSYQGRQFNFCIRGLSIGDVGIAHLTAQGAVYDLKSLDDFSGNYFALSGGFALALGESAAIMKNQRGVMMEIELQEVGLRFNLAATGVKIAMAGERHCKAANSAPH
jgi:hypothetical protein